MEIFKIARKCVEITYKSVRCVLWRGWKITYDVLCIPKKLLDIAIRRFRNNPQPSLPPSTQIISNPSPTIQKIESPTQEDEPTTTKQVEEPIPIPSQGSSGSFENVQQPGVDKSSSDIVESVKITKQEVAPGLLAGQSKQTGLWAMIFGVGNK